MEAHLRCHAYQSIRRPHDAAIESHMSAPASTQHNSHSLPWGPLPRGGGPLPRGGGPLPRGGGLSRAAAGLFRAAAAPLPRGGGPLPRGGGPLRAAAGPRRGASRGRSPWGRPARHQGALLQVAAPPPPPPPTPPAERHTDSTLHFEPTNPEKTVSPDEAKGPGGEARRVNPHTATRSYYLIGNGFDEPSAVVLLCNGAELEKKKSISA